MALPPSIPRRACLAIQRCAVPRAATLRACSSSGSSSSSDALLGGAHEMRALRRVGHQATQAIAPLRLRNRCGLLSCQDQLPPAFALTGSQLRRVAILTQGPPPPSSGGSDGGSSGSQPSSSVFRRGVVIVLKGIGIWGPALFFWVSLVWGGTFFDYRTQEEIEEDDAEVRRLERFFDVEGLPDDEYLTEWSSKDEALSKMVDKLLRSQRFVDCMTTGSSEALPGSQSSGNEATSVEVSFVLPPIGIVGAGDDAADAGPGPRPWYPRLMLAHRLGSIALVSVSFEHVPGKKDREERWACMSLRCDLVALPNGEAATGESICDLRGPVPHGVRYMRI